MDGKSSHARFCRCSKRCHQDSEQKLSVLFTKPEKEGGLVSCGLIVLLSPKGSLRENLRFCVGFLSWAVVVHLRVNRDRHCGSPGTGQSLGLKRGSCLILHGSMPPGSQLCFSFMRAYILQPLSTFLDFLGKTKVLDVNLMCFM